MKEQPVVWIISADHWSRALLRAELIERGYDAVGYFTVGDALPERERRSPDLVVVDLDHVSREDATRLRELHVPLIALGSATNFAEEWVEAFSWTRLLRRPFSLGDVADAIEAVKT